MKCALALLLTLTALLAPARSFAGGFGLPAPVPFCQLQVGEIVIAPAGTPQPAGYPFYLTPEIANSFSEFGRQLIGIPPGYTIAVDIFSVRAWTGNLPAWLLVPITPGVTPPIAPSVTPPAGPPPAPKVCPPPPVCAPPAPKPCAPPAPKPCAPPPCPPVLGNPGGLGGGFGVSARRF